MRSLTDGARPARSRDIRGILMDTFLIDVPVPSMGATVNELTVIDVKVKAGDRLAKGEKIAELESDKSVFEFEAPCDGTLRTLACRPGDIVPSGSPFMRIETADQSLKHLEVKDAAPLPHPGPAPAAPVSAPVAAPVPSGAAAPAVAASTPPPAVRPSGSPVRNGSGPQWTPRALKLLQEAGVDPATVTSINGTGPGGRVSGDDVARYLESRNAAAATSAPKASAAVVGEVLDETVCIAGVGHAVPKNVRPTSEILREFP